jgi:hypothetical protein
LLRVTANIV